MTKSQFEIIKKEIEKGIDIFCNKCYLPIFAEIRYNGIKWYCRKCGFKKFEEIEK